MKQYFKSNDGKFYETEELCLKADEEFQKKTEMCLKEKNERAAAAKELTELEKQYKVLSKEVSEKIDELTAEFNKNKQLELDKLEALANLYNNKLELFVKKYHYYHKTIDTNVITIKNPFAFFMDMMF